MPTRYVVIPAGAEVPSISFASVHLTEVLNFAYGVEETRSRRKRFAFALVFGPFLALAFIVACGLMLIGPQGAGWFAGAGGAARGVGSVVGMAALPGSTLPAGGGAFGRLPLRARRLAAFRNVEPGGYPRCNTVGGCLGRFLHLHARRGGAPVASTHPYVQTPGKLAANGSVVQNHNIGGDDEKRRGSRQ
jgi:hypothetical protein